MTTSTIARPVRSRRTPFEANPVRFCTACVVERSIMEQKHDAELKGMCTACAESNAVALITRPATAPSTEETTEQTAARLTALGLNPTTGDVRRCGSCETNISTLVGAEYCSEACKADEAAAQAQKAARAAAKTKPLPADVQLTVRWSIRDELTEHEIRVALNNAWKFRDANKRFTGESVAAAARVWFEDYNRDTFKRGTRNTKVLRVLNAVRNLVEG